MTTIAANHANATASILQPLDRNKRGLTQAGPLSPPPGPAPSHADQFDATRTSACRKVTDCGLPVSAKPCITSAKIIIPKEIYTRTDTFSPPPAYRDPMIIEGKGVPGATIRVFNPDEKGWPMIAETEVGPDGTFRAEATDERFFARGDRAHVVQVEPGKRPSEGELVETLSFTQYTRVHEHYHDHQLRNRTESVEMVTNLKDADDNPPYYDAKLVSWTPVAGAPSSVMRLTGQAKAVPPKCQIRVWGGAEPTTAAKDGSFSLDVKGLRPGGLVEIELVDHHGRRTNVPFVAPTLEVSASTIVSSAAIKNGVLELKTGPLFGKNDALVVRNGSTGASQRLVPNAQGMIQARVEGVEPFQVLDFGLEQGGCRSNRIQSFVVVPSGCDVDQKPGANLIALDDVRAHTPSFVESLSASCLQSDDRAGCGTSLQLPAITGLPPHGRVDVLRDGTLAYQLRADASGVVPPARLSDVAPGEKLGFFAFDAGGRAVGVDVPRFAAPSLNAHAPKPELKRSTENHTLAELVKSLGTGELDPPPSSDAVDVAVRLNPHDHHKTLGVKETAGERLELYAGPVGETFAEAKDADEIASMRLAVADWSTGTRNIVIEHYDGQDAHRTTARVPLAVVGHAEPLEQQGPLPPVEVALAVLGRAVGFAALARSVGQGVNDKAYEGPMRVARTMMAVLDRHLKVLDQAAAEQIRTSVATLVAPLSSAPVDAGRYVPSPGATPTTPSEELDKFWNAVPASRNGAAIPAWLALGHR